MFLKIILKKEGKFSKFRKSMNTYGYKAVVHKKRGWHMSQSLYDICSPTFLHKGWSGCAAASFVYTVCMDQCDIQIFT